MFSAHSHHASILVTTLRLRKSDPIFSIIFDDVGVRFMGHRWFPPERNELGSWSKIRSSKVDEEAKHLRI